MLNLLNTMSCIMGYIICGTKSRRDYDLPLSML